MSGNLYKMPVLIVSLVIGIIMVTAVILPLSSEYSEAKTIVNEGYFPLTIIDEDTDITISWDHTKPMIVTVDSEDIDLSDMPRTLSVSLVGTDTAIIRMEIQSNDIVVIMYNGTGGQKIINSSGSDDMTVSLTGSSLSASFGATTRSATITEGIYIDPNGQYVMKNKDIPAYVKDDTIILAGMTSISAGVAVGVFGIGNVENGITISNIVTNQTNFTFGDVTINADDTNYIDTYKLNSIVFDIENSNDGTSTTATYTYFAVPHEITADPDNPAAYKSLVMVIPLMAFVVLVVAAAAMIYYKKD